MGAGHAPEFNSPVRVRAVVRCVSQSQRAQPPDGRSKEQRSSSSSSHSRSRTIWPTDIRRFSVPLRAGGSVAWGHLLSFVHSGYLHATVRKNVRTGVSADVSLLLATRARRTRVAGGQNHMTNYSRMYRLGITPWERYGQAAAASIAALLDREEAERSRPLGRAIDLGCGRGQYTPELARRGWQTLGIDYVPAAIEAAKSRGAAGITYVVGDVTNLSPTDLGTFDFFLDIGCFQGFDAEQRRAVGRGVTALANPSATLLMLAFGPSRMRSFVGGVSRAEVEMAFPEWEMVAVEHADTAGLGWPMRKTAPRWYRLHRRA